MHSSTLLASILAASALALPQVQLEKRQQGTVTRTVTVTVFVTPGATSSRPAFTPPVRPSTTSSTRPPTTPPSFTPPTRPSNVAGNPPSFTPPTRPSASSSSAVVGNPLPGNPGPSNVPPPANGAPVDPGHTPGPQQAFLTVNSGLAYRNSILFHHNQARANHGSQPLVWNETVAATAKITADTCIFEHSVPDNVRQGQNLYTVSGDYFNVTAAITESWYKGEFPFMRNYYGATDIPSNVFGQVGHLTQVVWNGTTSVGCYSLDCGNRMVVFGETNSKMNKYTVCNYWPAGNVRTQYALNVGRPRSNTALGNYAD